jgi:hypothetical protein
MPHNKKRPPPNPPKVIRDKTTFLGGHTKIYDLQKFLGKVISQSWRKQHFVSHFQGGFARVFSLKSRDTGNIYAGKCVWKQHIHNRSTARKVRNKSLSNFLFFHYTNSSEGLFLSFFFSSYMK